MSRVLKHVTLQQIVITKFVQMTDHWKSLLSRGGAQMLYFLLLNPPCRFPLYGLTTKKKIWSREHPCPACFQATVRSSARFARSRSRALSSARSTWSFTPASAPSFARSAAPPSDRSRHSSITESGNTFWWEAKNILTIFTDFTSSFYIYCLPRARTKSECPWSSLDSGFH